MESCLAESTSFASTGFSLYFVSFVLFVDIQHDREGDGKLAAAVGDGTARVWTLPSWDEEKLAHPSYVYTAQFHPASSTMLATGGFDRVIRLWGGGREASPRRA